MDNTQKNNEITVEHIIPNGVKLSIGNAFMLMRRTPSGWVQAAFRGDCTKQSALWLYFDKHIKNGSTPIA